MKRKTVIVLLVLIAMAAVVASGRGNRKNIKENVMEKASGQRETATFAGGCFWCVEADLEKARGVISVISGYSGGDEINPSYEDVSSGKTGHREAVQVTFDNRTTSYEAILDVFFRHMDPTDPGGQFADRGFQYSPAVFYHDDHQRLAAEKYLKDLAASGRFDKPVATPVIPYRSFYPAEDYHQDYHQKNPAHYKRYREGSGRGPFIEKVWTKKIFTGKYNRPDPALIKKNLSPMAYHVTQENGTEPPFKNEHWNSVKQGIYVDIVSGEPLFSSLDKFDSGTGWPSFTRPLAADHVREKTDRTLFMPRTEVRSAIGDSHLGHVFNDGPAPTGLRYCINSAALRFIPREKLEQEGYGDFLDLFKGK